MQICNDLSIGKAMTGDEHVTDVLNPNKVGK
jgi:hypothetical protein